MTVELLTATEEFEQEPGEQLEVEMKLLPRDPRYFDGVKKQGFALIKQLYLSHPDDFGSLRLRKRSYGDLGHYSATHKTPGRVVPNGLMRSETNTPISQETFEFYEGLDYPRLEKIRADLGAGVSIDWIEGYQSPIVEIENIGQNPAAQAFLERHQEHLVDMTARPEADNEWIAHRMSGKENLPAKKAVTAEKMAAEIQAFHDVLGVKKMAITIGGRSGSGKSTEAEKLHQLLSHTFKRNVALISTDDYHIGQRQLVALNGGEPWRNWDDRIVFNIDRVVSDIQELQAGRSVPKRRFSFQTQEPEIVGTVQPADIIIVEGLHSGDHALGAVRKLHFEMSTSLAESLGRDFERLRRNNRANQSIASPPKRLSHVMEFAEPVYLSLEKPVNRRTWSESVRRPL
jgi:uridine kinase